MLNRCGHRAVAVSTCTEAQATYNGLFDLVRSDVILLMATESTWFVSCKKTA